MLKNTEAASVGGSHCFFGGGSSSKEATWLDRLALLSPWLRSGHHCKGQRRPAGRSRAPQGPQAGARHSLPRSQQKWLECVLLGSTLRVSARRAGKSPGPPTKHPGKNVLCHVLLVGKLPKGSQGVGPGGKDHGSREKSPFLLLCYPSGSNQERETTVI